MSTKVNKFLAAAALSAGVVAGATPISESLLNDMPVKALHAAEIDDGTGKVMVFATVTIAGDDVARAVADASGNVRLYSDGSAVVALMKKTNLVPGAALQFVKFNKSGNVGDPIQSLKAKYKKAVVESAQAEAKRVERVNMNTAAAAQGWDTALGTPENEEYTDLVLRLATVQEWADLLAAQKTTLAAALTAAGIDPLTVV